MTFRLSPLGISSGFPRWPPRFRQVLPEYPQLAGRDLPAAAYLPAEPTATAPSPNRDLPDVEQFGNFNRAVDFFSHIGRLFFRDLCGGPLPKFLSSLIGLMVSNQLASQESDIPNGKQAKGKST
jgi:hypothetical protein